MLKNKLKILLTAAAALALMLCLSTGASADASGSCGSGVTWKYESSSGTLTISGSGAMNNYSRTSMPWYSYRDSITSVVIESGVTHIGTEAFYEHANLKSAVIGDTVRSIGSTAFCWCEDLQAVEIPASVKTIGDSAFWCCLDLAELSLNEGLETLGETVFMSCGLLEEVTLPQSLREIGYWCFGDCYGLKSINIPSGVKALPESLFSGCTALKTVNLNEGLESIGGSAFAYCFELQNLEIPKTVKTIGNSAFYLCYALGELTVPGSVHSIGEYCFGQATGLSLIRFEGPAPTFEDTDIFSGCTLTALYPEGEAGWTEDILHGYGGDAVWYPYASRGVETGGKSGQTQWSVLGDRLTISGSGSMENHTAIEPAPWSRLGGIIRHITVTEGVTGIGDYAFAGLENVREIHLPESITYLGSNAFAGSGLSKLKFSGNAPVMEENAFGGCTAELTYPADGLWSEESMQQYGGTLTWTAMTACAEHDFTLWTSIAAPSCEGGGVEKRSCNVCGAEETRFTAPCGHTYGDVESIVPDCLEYGYSFSLCSVCGAGKVTERLAPLGHSWDGGSSSGSKITYTCTCCGEVRYEYTISGTCGSNVRWTLDTDSGVLRILGSGAMNAQSAYSLPWKSYVDSIRHVVVESGVTSIGAEAFFECGSIETVTLADTVKSIGTQAFVWCDSMVSINLPEGIKTIPDSAFWGCKSLKELTLPTTLKTIGEDAFYTCESLERLVIPEGVTSIGELAFWQCYGLEEVSIPSTLVNLGPKTFMSCSSLETVHLPDTLLSIGESTFDGCRLLKNISLPESLQSIGEYAFYNCAALEKLVIPGNVKSVGIGAFSYCGGLLLLRFAGGPPEMDANAFKNLETTVLYPGTVSAWTSSLRQQYGGTVRWVAYGSGGVSASGWAGSLSWRVQGETLVIGGSGSMSFYGNAPWYHLRGIIKRVEIGSQVTSIYSKAFKDLSCLETITIPESVTNIGSLAFSGCGSLKNVVFLGSPPSIYSNAFSGVNAVCSYPSGVGWTSSYTKNYEGRLSWTARSGSCGSHEYGEWYSVEDADCVNGGTMQRDCLYCGEFERSSSAAPGHSYAVTVKSPTCSYDGYTLHECSVCGFYYMDSYVASPGHSWDGGSLSGTKCTYTCTACGETRSEYVVSGSCGSGVYWKLSTETGLLTIYGSGSMRSFGRTSMPWYSYKDSITKVVIESGVRSIGSYAFYEHPVLETVEIASTVKSLGLGSFCWSESLKSVTIPEGVTSIPEDCFWACLSLTELNLPSTIRTIGQGAFYSTKISEIYLADGITSIGEDAFWQCVNLKSVTVPSGVTKIQSTCFAGCSSLESVSLPDGISHIYSSAFSGCKKLKSLTLPDKLQFMDTSALSNASISTLTFPSGFKTLERYALGGYMKTLYFTGNAPDFDDQAFSGLTLTVYYPQGNPTWTSSVRQNYGGTVTWRSADICGHDYREYVTAPGCVNEGWTDHICSLCYDSYRDSYTEMLGHDYVSDTVAPTCTQQGYTIYTCSVCGDSYEADYVAAVGHSYTAAVCTVCGEAHPNLANYKGKVISILGDSISTFAGYIPVADGFNLEHLARYPDASRVPDVTDVNQTWWMQTINTLDAKLGINDSWRGSTVSGYASVTTGVAGYLAAMSNTTQLQNLGSNGTPDVILFYGGTNDLAHTPNLGSFDPATAPTEVDLSTLKWDNLADAYANILLRLKYYYPDAQLVCLLPTYTASYYSDAKLAEGNALMAEVCEHYGVVYTDLRYCGISAADLPDGIHPGAAGMDYITNAVLDTLVSRFDTTVGENTVYSVSHELAGVSASRSYYKGVSAGKAFTETLEAEGDISVTVTMGGTDITDDCYTNGEISIDSVSGDIVIKAEAKFSLGERLQSLPESCCGTNLWPLLRHDTDYYTVSGWGTHSSGKVRSATFAIGEGAQLWATSFGEAGENGATINGIRLTWFGEDGVIKSLSADETYTEFSANGYVTAPDGANAVNVVMWTADDTNELYVLSAEHAYQCAVCTLCGHDEVRAAEENGSLTVCSDELESGTVLYTAVYDQNGRMVKAVRNVWDGGDVAVEIPEGSTWKLMFLDGDNLVLRKSIEK